MYYNISKSIKMPKLPIDYSKTIIYKIICCDPNIKDCYVGHTTDFTRRKQKHKSCCNNPNSKCYNYKLYSNIREKGDWDNWQMIMVEEFKCDNKLEATKREREYLEKLQANLNGNVPSRTVQEHRKSYYQEHKHEIIKKVYCPHCNLDLSKSSLNEHIRRKHTPPKY